ncbi:unnamed protein product [Closterium sp. Naga37s-1]|nr:unnamed protein product [Closterium sp. Naga37s-1]
MSWLRLDPTPRVVLLGTHPSLASVAAEFPNHVSVDADVDTNLEGTPLLNSVLARIQAFGAASSDAASPHCDLAMLVDPDVLLFNDVIFAARRLASRFSSFVMLSAPWDVHTFRFSLDQLPPHIHPSSSAKAGAVPYRSSAASRDRFPTHVAAPAPSSGSTRRRRSAPVWDSPDQADSGEVNEQEIRDYVRQRGQLNVAAGATVLMWNRPAAPLLHPSVAIPPFFLGRGSYLRWLVARAAGSLSATAANGTNGNGDGNVTAQVGRAATELEAADEAGVPAAAWRDDPESRFAVDATDAVTAVRVFSALDAQREAQLAVEKRRGETGGVAENSVGNGGRRKKAGFVSRLARSISPRQAPQRRRLLGGAESAQAGRSHHSSGGLLSGESFSFGQGALWQPLPGKNAKRWEVYANAHMARIQRLAGGFSIEGGSLSHAPWRLAPCFVPGGESMCLMRRRRPGNCSCEHTPFAGRSTGDTRPYDANWLSCGETGMEQNLDADFLRDLRSGPHGADPSLSSLEDEFALGLEDMGGLRLPSSIQTEPTVAKSNSLTAAVAEAALSARNGTKPSTKGKKSLSSEKKQAEARTTAQVAFWRGTEGLPHSLEQLLPIVASEQQAVILLAASFEDREAAMNSICRLRNLGMANYILAALDARMYAYAFLQGIPVFMHKASVSNQSANPPTAAFVAPSSNDTSSASLLAAVAPVLMMQILRLGYSVLWADVHTVWFSNPLPYLLSLDSNTLAVQSMSSDMHHAPNSARTIGAGVLFARPSHLSLKALASVVAYMAAVRAEAGEEGGIGGGSGAEGEDEVEEYRAFHDVLCGEGGRLKAGKDLCRWNNGFKVVFLDRGLFPTGSIKGIWDTPPSLGGLGRTCEKLGCIAVQNSGIVGRASRAERLHAHGLRAYDSRRRMCIRSWGVVEQREEQAQRHFMRR